MLNSNLVGYFNFLSFNPNIFFSLLPIPYNSKFSLNNKLESQLPVANFIYLFPFFCELSKLLILVSLVKLALGVELNPPPLLHPQAYI